jgi:hypothetical protein
MRPFILSDSEKGLLPEQREMLKLCLDIRSVITGIAAPIGRHPIEEFPYGHFWLSRSAQRFEHAKSELRNREEGIADQ